MLVDPSARLESGLVRPVWAQVPFLNGEHYLGFSPDCTQDSALIHFRTDDPLERSHQIERTRDAD
jgi:hypothetical protein